MTCLAATTFSLVMAVGTAWAIDPPGWRTAKDPAGCTVASTVDPSLSLRHTLAGETVATLRATVAAAGTPVLLVSRVGVSHIEVGRSTGSMTARGDGVLTVTLPVLQDEFSFWGGAVDMLDGRGKAVAALPFGALEGALGPLSQCLALLRNVDPGSGRPAAVQPVLQSVVTPEYPPSALRAGEHGATVVELTVSAKGLVSDCRVVQSSGSYTLDAATCSVLRRTGRFAPARDAVGAATEGSVRRTLNWQIP